MRAWLHPNVRGLLGLRWTLAILDIIERGVAHRPAQLMRLLGMRHRLVYDRLERMRNAGWLRREDNEAYPRRVEYFLRQESRWHVPLSDWRRLGLDWEIAREMLAHRWMPPLLFAAGTKPCCFLTLKALMPGIADKVLAEHLHRLHNLGILVQGGYDGKSWLLTPVGVSAMQALSLLTVVASGESRPEDEMV